ncbi:MAG TPA: hypothetical protein VGE58_10865, partial [Daejeonella sp.]
IKKAPVATGAFFISSILKEIDRDMKRFMIPLLLILLSVMSCTKEYIVPNRTIVTELRSGNWVNTNGGRNYTAAISMPEIDDFVNENHGVLVYISFGDRSFEQIPQVYSGVSYSYYTKPGQIVMEIQASDGTSVITPPGSMTVKIVLIESLQ